MAPTTRSRGLLQPIDTNQNESKPKQDTSKKVRKPKKTTKVNLAEIFEAESEIIDVTDDWSSEDFVILETLGEGSQARVVKGLHKASGKVYAIKQIDYNINRKYATREITIHSSLDHPGIVKMHGYYFASDDKKDLQLCLVLDYCPRTVLDKIKSEGRIDETEASQMLREIVDVFAYLHKEQIIHRDVKLANILLDSQDQIKVADFGIAVRVRDPKSRKTIIGTQGYAGPEIDLNTERTTAGTEFMKKAEETGNYDFPPPGVELYDSQYTAQVDLYSLGVTLYAILTGDLPVEGEEDSEFDLCFGNPQLDLDIPDYLSSNCVTLLQGLLEEDPQCRLTLDEVRSHPWTTRAEDI